MQFQTSNMKDESLQTNCLLIHLQTPTCGHLDNGDHLERCVSHMWYYHLFTTVFSLSSEFKSSGVKGFKKSHISYSLDLEYHIPSWEDVTHVL